MAITDEEKFLSTINVELLKLKVDVWKTVIDVQKHFNDLEMKVRNFGILILSAFIGAIGVSFNSSSNLVIFGGNYSVSGILAFGAAIVWLLFYFVDVYWYHPLLLGAVKKGLEIEKEIGVDIANIDLTKTIGDSSPKDILCFKNVHSTTKAKVFYFGVLTVLVITGVCMMIFNSPSKTNPYEKVKIEAQCTRNVNYDGYQCSFNALPESTNKKQH
ncbi:hypothetical protein ACSYAE_00355 [Edwardsiella tarda]|uniref:hypothetical protein n=1 Tax=Edwardsiella tarda TaxID=636 RepID=UPI003F660A72